MLCPTLEASLLKVSSGLWNLASMIFQMAFRHSHRMHLRFSPSPASTMLTVQLVRWVLRPLRQQPRRNDVGSSGSGAGLIYLVYSISGTLWGYLECDLITVRGLTAAFALLTFRFQQHDLSS